MNIPSPERATMNCAGARERMTSSEGRLSRLHLIVGTAGGVAFLVTGLYMHFALAHLSGLEDTPRALYRSGHIYLLFGALLNLAAGTHVAAARSPWQRNVQWLGSSLLLLSPAVFLYGFAAETPLGAVERTWTQLGIFSATAGVVLHVLGGWRKAQGRSDEVLSSTSSPPSNISPPAAHG